MLKPELETLIRQSLRALDAVELESLEGVHRYQLLDGLKDRLGREEILITFAARTAAQRPDVDLVTVGSYLYDLILRLVREKGRAAAGWLAPAPEADPAAAVLRVAPRLKGRAMKPVRRAWGVVYLFTFRFGFHFDTPHEKLYTVRVDHDGERIRHDVHPWRLVELATPEAAVEWGPTPHVDPERAFRFAWEKVEEEVARLTVKYGQETEALLHDEIRTIETYYRELIDEEKRSREQKNTKRGREESEQKIELLKLEWDRRVVEEKKRLRPEVAVSLSCAAYLRTPLEKWKCLPRGGTREAVAEFWVDLHSGDAWPARPTRRKPVRPSVRGRGVAADDAPGGEPVADEPVDLEAPEPEELPVEDAPVPRLQLVDTGRRRAPARPGGESDRRGRATPPSEAPLPPPVELTTVAGGLDGSADDMVLVDSLVDPPEPGASAGDEPEQYDDSGEDPPDPEDGVSD